MMMKINKTFIFHTHLEKKKVSLSYPIMVFLRVSIQSIELERPLDLRFCTLILIHRVPFEESG